MKVVSEVVAASRRPFPLRIAANQNVVRHIAERTDLLPVGMLIGPFLLMTKLVAHPIVPVAMAGSGVTADEEPSVLLVERCMALAEATAFAPMDPLWRVADRPCLQRGSPAFSR